MGFVSYSFVLSVGILLVVYYRIPGKWQWPVLLAASIAFVTAESGNTLAYLSGAALCAWSGGRWLRRNQTRFDRTTARRKNKVVLLLCLGTMLSVLCVCKVRFSFRNILLPLGISYYTFQAIGYLLDIHRGRETGTSNPLKLFLFLSYFPQLVQGPISRYSQLAPQLFAAHSYDPKQVSMGLQRLLWGYFKKLVIADRIAPAVSALRGNADTGIWLLSLLYGVQIYADFTGGMDIAIGLSQAFGIRLPENFLHPFGSKNVAEYWRRWHVTLGQWMRDYVFYPVSVSAPLRSLNQQARKKLGPLGKRVPVYLASAVTWLCTGIWHGITPNFLVWGMMNWGVITISQELTPLYQRFHRRFSWTKQPWYGAWEAARTFCLMNLIRAVDLFPNVGTYLCRLGTFPDFRMAVWKALGLSGTDVGILLAGIGLMTCVSIVQTKAGSLRELMWDRPILRYSLTFALFLCVLLMGVYGVGYDQGNFIYNQF